MNNPIVKLCCVLFISVVVVATGLCQGTIYTSRPAFETVLSSSTTVTFEDVPPTLLGGVGEWSVTSHGVVFTNSDRLLFVTDPNGPLYPIPGDGQYLWHFDGRYPVTVLLPDGMTAFGADFSGGIEPNPFFNATLTVNLAGGGSYDYNFSAAQGTWAFFGVTFPEPIASLVYDDGGTFFHEETLDNVTFGTVIPEPGTLGLFAFGALLLGWRWRKLRARNCWQPFFR